MNRKVYGAVVECQNKFPDVSGLFEGLISNFIYLFRVT